MLAWPKQIIREVRLIWRLMRDARVPRALKFIPLLAMVYLPSPLDFLPDRVPWIGLLDDVLFLLFGFWLFRKLAPPAIVQGHLEDMNSISTRYKVDGEDRKNGKGAWRSG